MKDMDLAIAIRTGVIKRHFKCSKLELNRYMILFQRMNGGKQRLRQGL